MLQKALEKLENNPNQLTKIEIDTLLPLINKNIIYKEENNYKINSKYLIGKIKISNNQAQLITSNQYQKIFIALDKLKGALDNDTVVAKKIFHPRSKYKAVVETVLESSSDNILVYIKEKKYCTIKDSIILRAKIDTSYQDGDILLLNSKNLKVEKLLGNISDPKVDELISLNLYNQSYRLEPFNEKIESNPDKSNRVDLTHLPFSTIDPVGAKDHDDAIYYDTQKNILYVAIADVSAYVFEGSSLDKYAKKRATSVYFPHKVLPMLPEELSNDLCSLKPYVERFAYVYEIHFDKNQSVKKSKRYEAIIESKKKFSYGRIDRVLEKKFDTYTQEEKEIFDSIIELYEVTKAIRAKRLEKGYDFRTQEIRQKLDNDTQLESISIEESSPSHQLIEECMLLANIEASLDVGTNGIFRIHEEPSLQKVETLLEHASMLGLNIKRGKTIHETILQLQKAADNAFLRDEIDKIIIQSQQLARYSSQNLGHFGLGFDSYSHFTSPIRRYADLILHRMLKTKQVPKDLDEQCEYISNTARDVDIMVWDLEDRKFARYAQEHIGVQLEAKIYDTQNGMAKVEKKFTGMKVKLDNYSGQKLFSPVQIEITDADIFSKRINARVIG